MTKTPPATGLGSVDRSCTTDTAHQGSKIYHGGLIIFLQKIQYLTWITVCRYSAQFSQRDVKHKINAFMHEIHYILNQFWPFHSLIHL